METLKLNHTITEMINLITTNQGQQKRIHEWKDFSRKYSDKSINKRDGKYEKEHVCLIKITKTEESNSWIKAILEEIIAQKVPKIQESL